MDDELPTEKYWSRQGLHFQESSVGFPKRMERVHSVVVRRSKEKKIPVTDRISYMQLEYQSVTS